MGTGRLCRPRALLSPPALSDQQRLTVNEKEKVFKVTKFVGSEEIRNEAEVLRQKLYITEKQFPDNNVQSVSVDFLSWKDSITSVIFP